MKYGEKTGQLGLVILAQYLFCQSFISDSGGQSCKAGEFYYAGNGKGALAYGSDGSFAAAVFSGWRFRRCFLFPAV